MMNNNSNNNQFILFKERCTKDMNEINDKYKNLVIELTNLKEANHKLIDKNIELNETNSELSNKNVELSNKNVELSNKNLELSNKNLELSNKNLELLDNLEDEEDVVEDDSSKYKTLLNSYRSLDKSYMEIYSLYGKVVKEREETFDKMELIIHKKKHLSSIITNYKLLSKESENMLKEIRKNRQNFLIDSTKIVLNSNKKILDKDVDMHTTLDYSDIKVILRKILEDDLN